MSIHFYSLIFVYFSVHRQGGRVLYRKITRKLSETSRKISRKFSSRRICTASDARKAPTLKPICRATKIPKYLHDQEVLKSRCKDTTQLKMPKYSDDQEDTTTLNKPTLQRMRKITQARRPQVDRSDDTNTYRIG